MPNVLLGVSLDGNRRHSSNRIFANGDESFDRAIKGTKLLTKPFGIAVTITKTNEDVDEVYDYLYNSFPKCDAISMQQVRGMDDDNPMSFTNIDIDNMLYHYDLLVKKMYRCAEMKEYDYIFKLLRGSDFFGRYIRNILHPNMLYKYRCDAARSRISVDDKGDIYSCSVMNGNIDFKIGNIYSGISECARKKFLDAQVDSVETCSKCDEKYICGGECLAKAYLKSNKVDEPVEELCNLRKELIAKARSFVESIKINLPEAYYEFQKFTIDPTLLDTSAWAIKKILREFGKEISFRELYSKMEYDRMGASLSILERKINEYGIELLARQLEDEQELNEIIVPAIAWQNRFTKAYRYIVIKKICDNNVVLEDASMENEFVMSTKDFFAKVSNVIFEVREKVEGVNELEWRDKCKET
jgi:radical SAM protein with 4Fe4S-binding SPASM domain